MEIRIEIPVAYADVPHRWSDGGEADERLGGTLDRRDGADGVVVDCDDFGGGQSCVVILWEAVDAGADAGAGGIIHDGEWDKGWVSKKRKAVFCG